MREFAKIFQSDQYGQLLCVADVDEDDKPELKILGIPPRVGLSSMGFGFPSFEKLDKAFEKLTLERVERVVSDMFELSKETE